MLLVNEFFRFLGVLREKGFIVVYKVVGSVTIEVRILGSEYSIGFFFSLIMCVYFLFNVFCRIRIVIKWDVFM